MNKINALLVFPIFCYKKLILSIHPSGDARELELIEKIEFILHKSAINWNYLKFFFGFAMEISFTIDFFPTTTIHIH